MPETERTTYPVPDILRTLRERLLARPNLAGMDIATAPSDHASTEYIEFDDVDGSAEHGALGRMRMDHTFTLRGLVWVQRTGSGEDAIDEARTRAYEVMDELLSELVQTVAGHQITSPRGVRSTLTTKLAQCNLRQGIGDGERVAMIDFAIECFDQTTRG